MQIHYNSTFAANSKMRYTIKLGLTGILLLFNFIFSWAQQVHNLNKSQTLSLSDVWHRAEKFSKSIEIKELKIKQSDALLKNAHAERLPELSIRGNYEKATNIPIYEDGLFNKPTQHEVIHDLYKIGVDGYLNIYNGNKINLKIAEEETLHHIALEQKNFTVSEIKLQATAHYLTLQKSRIFRSLMIQDIAEQEKQLAEIRNYHKHGVVLKSDVLRVELKLSRQKMSLVEIENDILIATQRLNIIIGEPDEKLISVSDEIGSDSLHLKSYEEYLAEAMEKSYENRISEHETKLRKIEFKNVRANVSPKIGMYGDFYYANPQIFLYPYNDHLYSLGLGGIKASFPISEIYHNKHKAKAAKIAFLQQEIEHADTQDKVRNQVKEGYLRFKESIIRIDVAKVNVAQATENLRIVRNTYFNQASLITDLLDADVQLLESRFDLAAAQISAQLHYFKLQNILGTL